MVKELMEWCCVHGHTMHFVGAIIDDEAEYMGEALFCPLCNPEHEDNPEVINRIENLNISECNKIMHM